jgi:hypothetical protein
LLQSFPFHSTASSLLLSTHIQAINFDITTYKITVISEYVLYRKCQFVAAPCRVSVTEIWHDCRLPFTSTNGTENTQLSTATDNTAQAILQSTPHEENTQNSIHETLPNSSSSHRDAIVDPFNRIDDPIIDHIPDPILQNLPPTFP